MYVPYPPPPPWPTFFLPPVTLLFLSTCLNNIPIILECVEPPLTLTPLTLPLPPPPSPPVEEAEAICTIGTKQEVSTHLKTINVVHPWLEKGPFNIRLNITDSKINACHVGWMDGWIYY